LNPQWPTQPLPFANEPFSVGLRLPKSALRFAIRCRHKNWPAFVTALESVGRFLEFVSRLSVDLITPHSLASTPVLKSESTGNRMQTGEA
jgi:hypothetical protein